MGNITSLVNTQWYVGLPFNDTTNLRLGIGEFGEQILGQSLLGLQAGNEPDLYGAVSRVALTHGSGLQRLTYFYLAWRTGKYLCTLGFCGGVWGNDSRNQERRQYSEQD